MTNEPEDVELPSVEQQRTELAATVEALAAKVDVTTRVKGAATERAQHLKAQHLKETTTERAAHLKSAASQQTRTLRDRPEIIAAVAGVVVAAAVVVGIRRRRARRGHWG